MPTNILEFMTEPGRWPAQHFVPAPVGYQMICLKKWLGTNYECARLLYRDGVFYFQPDSGLGKMEGGRELPLALLKQGWKLD